MNVVLLSGGWDSVYCLTRAIQESKVAPLCVFFRYGQPYLKEEEQAVARLQEHLGDRILATVWTDLPDVARDGKVFADRNETFIKCATHHYGGREADTVYFGCRNPFQFFDEYGDSNWQFGKRMAKKYGITVKMPCVLLPKFVIRNRVFRFGITKDMIFSSEGYQYAVHSDQKD